MRDAPTETVVLVGRDGLFGREPLDADDEAQVIVLRQVLSLIHI